MTGQAAALEIVNLTVHYGARAAVRDLSLSLRRGEIAALLGPNGAGKSTALLAAAGALAPSRGAVRILGADMAAEPLAARARVGLADQPPSLYDFFTVAEQLAFVAEARGGDGGDGGGGGGDGDGGDAQRRLLAALGLDAVADRLCRELSFGMRQRVGLATALVGGVGVVLLDETLNGLDPRAAKSAREVLASAAERGAAVLMSTHLLGVAERICHRILIMDRGELRADLAGDELGALLDGGPGALEQVYLEAVADPDAEAEAPA